MTTKKYYYAIQILSSFDSKKKALDYGRRHNKQIVELKTIRYALPISELQSYKNEIFRLNKQISRLQDDVDRLKNSDNPNWPLDKNFTGKQYDEQLATKDSM